MQAEIRASVAGVTLRGKSIFIAKRLPGGDMGERWEFPGGKVEPGESGAEAVAREYREEFNAEAKALLPVAEARFEHGGKTYRLDAFLVEFDPGRPGFTLNEHSEWKWASVAEIEGMDFADSDLKLLPQLKRYLDGE
jgi:8-oxo-dGTP diphosphatase